MNGADMLSRIAYMAYRRHTGGKSLVTGAELPEWEQIDPRIREAWCAALDAVIRTLLGRLGTIGGDFLKRVLA